MAVERKFVENAITKAKIADFIREELKRAEVSDVEIQRTPLITRIIVYVRRPGMVIGRKGKTIKQITEALEKEFGIENPRIDVKVVEVPELDPKLMAQRVARMIERGMKIRRVVHTALRQIMDAGAIGAEVYVKGKLMGKNAKAKGLRVMAGYLPKAGQPSHELVREGFTIAVPKQGIIGVHVKIVPPEVKLPDKLEMLGEGHGVVEEERSEGNE